MGRRKQHCPKKANENNNNNELLQQQELQQQQPLTEEEEEDVNTCNRDENAPVADELGSTTGMYVGIKKKKCCCLGLMVENGSNWT